MTNQTGTPLSDNETMAYVGAAASSWVGCTILLSIIVIGASSANISNATPVGLLLLWLLFFMAMTFFIGKYRSRIAAWLSFIALFVYALNFSQTVWGGNPGGDKPVTPQWWMYLLFVLLIVSIIAAGIGVLGCMRLAKEKR